jgi:hypothetical protein
LVVVKSAEIGQSERSMDRPLVWDGTEWVTQQSGAGRSQTDIIDGLLRQSYGPSAVVRSLVDAFGLTVASAKAMVTNRLNLAGHNS